MKYMSFIYPDRSVEPDAEARAGIQVAVGAWASKMDARGIRLQGHVLQAAEAARTVRIRDGRVLVDERPLAKSGEQISGFNILECETLDEALEVASKHPSRPSGRSS